MKYSVEEIQDMRQTLWAMCCPPGTTFKQADMAVQVEALLQTYMKNGTTPEELLAYLHKRQDEYNKARGIA